ncbi:MAG: metal ABC transporter ATP-binding protein [Deferribacteraceae bacterium]|jgi:zinc transport system ATP-binding protein|nr:metal ABC transporter ATP-binding protein [Deferribacteraceae bacterium]
MKPILSCSAAKFVYNSFTAADDITFELHGGEYLAILGENGSGKSTLMKGVLGLLKPASGKISYSGIKPQEIGYLPQQTVVQKDFPATVWEITLSGCQNRLGFPPFYSGAAKNRALDSLKYMQAEDLKSKPFRNLSGGQQQRVLLARALCAADKLLMLDEPAAGLDPVMTERLYALLSELNSQRGMAILMISHDPESAVRYSGKILHLSRNGHFFGTKDEYCSTPLYKRFGGSNA